MIWRLYISWYLPTGKNTKLEAIFFQSPFNLTLPYPFLDLLSLFLYLSLALCVNTCVFFNVSFSVTSLRETSHSKTVCFYYHLFWSIFLQITLQTLRPNMFRLTFVTAYRIYHKCLYYNYCKYNIQSKTHLYNPTWKWLNHFLPCY